MNRERQRMSLFIQTFSHHRCASFLYSRRVVSKQCGMKTKRFTLMSDSDSVPLSVMACMPDNGIPKAFMQIAHGMCGYKERFLPFMEYMTMNGVACVANDHRGHGASVRSHDDLGFMYSGGGEALVDDMVQVTLWIHDSYPSIPVFLLGHSMGSMAARVYVQKYDDLISGLILSGSPSWTSFSYLAYILTGAVSLLGGGRIRAAWPTDLVSGIYNIRFSSEGSRAWTCSDSAVRDEFEKNPLCNFIFTVNGIHGLMSLMIMSYQNGSWDMHNPELPVFFISGDDDPCKGTEEKFHMAAMDMCRHGYHNVKSALYGGMRHEILNEKEKEYVWNDILLFVESNLSGIKSQT